MANVLAKVHWGQALGVYLADGRIVFTEAASSPAGPVTTVSESKDVAAEDVGPAIKAWLTERYSSKKLKNLPICIGLTAEQAFFTTCVLSTEGTEAPTTQSLLDACGASGALDQDAASADFVKVKLGGSDAYCIAAANRDRVAAIGSALESVGAKKARLEPAPWSLPQLPDKKAKIPKKWKQYVRVQLTDSSGVAMIMIDGKPVLWRRFTLDEDPVAAITSAVRFLQVHAAQKLSIMKLSGLLLQGQVADDLGGRLTEETGFETKTGGDEGPTDQQYGLALAAAAKDTDKAGPNLLLSHRPPPTIKDIFPWKLAMFMVVLLVGMGYTLWNEATSLTTDASNIKRQLMTHVWANGTSTRDIVKEKKLLAGEVSAVEKFLSSRILWSNYLRDLPTRLPANACLTNITAFCEMKEMAAKKHVRKTNNSITIRGIAKFSDREKAPPEIDAFLESLRDVDLLKKDYPIVKLAEIKWRRDGREEIALFTILGMPKGK